MFEVETSDGRTVKLKRHHRAGWVNVEFISLKGNDVTWGVPEAFLGEFLQGLAESYADWDKDRIEDGPLH